MSRDRVPTERCWERTRQRAAASGTQEKQLPLQVEAGQTIEYWRGDLSECPDAIKAAAWLAYTAGRGDLFQKRMPDGKLAYLLVGRRRVA